MSITDETFFDLILSAESENQFILIMDAIADDKDYKNTIGDFVKNK